MKFGRNLARNQVPEWCSAYINYKSLKKLIKTIAYSATKEGEPVDTTRFFFALDRSLEDVDNFYNRKFAEASRRAKLLQDQYGVSRADGAALDADDTEDLVSALLDLRNGLRKLQWYGEVNRRGFVKITKKLDKKAPAHRQRGYVESRVDLAQFARNDQLMKLMTTTNDWLSTLGDAKKVDDASSTVSTSSLRRSSSRGTLALSHDTLAALEEAIRNDDASLLKTELQDVQDSLTETSDISIPKLHLNLLQRVITHRARACTDYLLSQVPSLDDPSDINHRNCLHRYLFSSNRARQADDAEKAAPGMAVSSQSNGTYITPAAAPSISTGSLPLQELMTTSEQGNDAVSFLGYLLQRLTPEQRPALRMQDAAGRLPLHYAAQFGLVLMVEIILKYMRQWDFLTIAKGVQAPFWQDHDGLSPLHLSIMGRHAKTTGALLSVCKTVDHESISERSRSSLQVRMGHSGDVLALATKLDFGDAIKQLLEARCDIDFQDNQGETALHLAARFGHLECARLLLDPTYGPGASLEVAEKTFGWTPLFVACVDGQQDVADLLISRGADCTGLDESGWTAQEHAALRGHIEIARMLAAKAPENGLSSSPRGDQSPSDTQSLNDRRSATNASVSASPRTTPPVKSFGHRYLVDQSLLLISLGTMDMRKTFDAVQLDQIPLADAHNTQLDTALSLVIHAVGASGEPTIVDLPAEEHASTDPIVFYTSDPTKVKLLFDLVPTYAGSRDHVIGRGVAMLGSLKPGIGNARATLQADLAVPIVAAHNLDVIGQVHFNFLVITPFKHPNLAVSEQRTYWKSMTSTMVIGHRGLGKNQSARRSLQLGENTIQSFIAAANLGASYVEFDVQLTKDHVPVIYHDFLVSETGIDAPMHTLTLEQFMHVGESRNPRVLRPEAAEGTANPTKSTDGRKQRSLSLSQVDDEDEGFTERMKHTRALKQNGFKGNSRGNFIQAPFTTLEEMFTKLPKHLGFNIEMKYPMLHESEEQEFDAYAVELNSFVDSVLTRVYDLGTDRNIIFSSFNPDICLLLSFKQPSIPILFLTDAGTCPVGDIRASSLQEAIRFASRWNLLGIVSQSNPFTLCPRLVRVVKESGLVCVSYGSENNDPEKVKLQVREGIDAVIVDSVLAIRQGLTGPEGTEIPGISDAAVNGSVLPNGKNALDDLSTGLKQHSLDPNPAKDSGVNGLGRAPASWVKVHD